MSSINDKSKPNGTSSPDYRLPTDGPHRYTKKTVDSEKEAKSQPPYVIAIAKDKPVDEAKLAEATSTYNPKEARSKAKMFLKSSNITSEQKDALKEILGPDEEPIQSRQS